MTLLISNNRPISLIWVYTVCSGLICTKTLENNSYEIMFSIYRTCLQENEDLKAAKKEFNTLFVRQREEQDSLRKVNVNII